MNELFASLYESRYGLGLYNLKYDLIFASFFNHGTYILLGLTFIFVPLILFAAFYYLWKYPYGKFWHWLSWLLVAAIITSLISWLISMDGIFSSNDSQLINALANVNSGYESFANSLILQIALYNGMLSIIVSFLSSIFFKKFSKIQIHLPF